MPLTVPIAQHTVTKRSALALTSVSIFKNPAGQWIATTDPADAVGHPAGYIALVGGHLVIDDAVTSGAYVVIRTSPPPAALLVYL